MRIVPILALVLGACGSENKLDEENDRDGTNDKPSTNTGTTGDGPGPDTETDADTDTDTDGDADADADSDGDADTDNPDGPPTGGSDTGPWTDTGSWGECEWAAHVAGYLDQFQTPGDGKVWYCHNDGGPVYVFQESGVDACLTHIAHSGDIFPTTICDS